MYQFVALIFVSLLAIYPLMCAAEGGEDIYKYSKACPSSGWPAPSGTDDLLSPRQDQPDVVPLTDAEQIFRVKNAVGRFRSVGAILGRDSPIATATLVAKEWVLTVSHKIPAAEVLSDHVFAIDWIVDYSVPGKAKLMSDRHVRCFPIEYTQIVASPPGHLDYMLLRIGADSHGHLPGALGVKPLRPDMDMRLPNVGSPVFLVGFRSHESAVKGLRYPEGNVVVGNGVVVGGSRWNKDVGSGRNIDYMIHSKPGLSGSPLLNGNHEWIAMHQRDLNLAKCDSFTPWHPYVSTYYSDRFAGASLASQVANQCKDKDAPGAFVAHDEVRKHELPRQATPIIDIASDLAERRGMQWLCREIPAFAEVLPKLDIYSCDPKRRAEATRVSAAVGGPGGGESSGAPSSGDR